jgi:hypothetical protein
MFGDCTVADQWRSQCRMTTASLCALRCRVVQFTQATREPRRMPRARQGRIEYLEASPSGWKRF